MAVALITLGSCASQENVSYVEGRHFFYNNNVPTGKAVKLTSKPEFEKYIGYAPVMGKNGEPTHIDFNSQMAIAMALPVTDTMTVVKPVSLKKSGDNELTLGYSVVKKGGKMSYSMLPSFVIIVDKKYQNCTIKQVEK